MAALTSFWGWQIVLSPCGIHSAILVLSHPHCRCWTKHRVYCSHSVITCWSIAPVDLPCLPMPHLRYTLGDPEAVKACIALSVSGAACDISPTALPRSIGLDFDEKGAISDSNAIARFLGNQHFSVERYTQGDMQASSVYSYSLRREVLSSMQVAQLCCQRMPSQTWRDGWNLRRSSGTPCRMPSWRTRPATYAGW